MQFSNVSHFVRSFDRVYMLALRRVLGSGDCPCQNNRAFTSRSAAARHVIDFSNHH